MPRQFLISISAAMTLSLLLTCQVQAQADEARKVFDSVYGSKVKAALATRDSADDLALATQLLEAAKESSDSPALMAVMCEQAHKLGASDAKGYDTAIEALRLLATIESARVAPAMEGIIDLRRKQFARAKSDEKAQVAVTLSEAIVELGDHKTAAGDHHGAAALYRQALVVARQFKLPDSDNIRLLAEQAAGRQQLEDRIGLLRAKLLQTSDKVTATELVMLHMVDLDSPKEALKFADRCEDEVLQGRVAQAAGEIGKLTDAQALDLASWYHELSGKAQGPVRASTLVRSARYYQQYLDLHTESDIQRKGAELALQEVTRTATELGAKLTPAKEPRESTATKPATTTTPAAGGKGGTFELGNAKNWDEVTDWATKPMAPLAANKPLPLKEWVEVLPLIDLKNHVVDGKWSWSRDKEMVLAPGAAGAFYVPFDIRGDCEFSMRQILTDHAGKTLIWVPTQGGFLQAVRDINENAGIGRTWIDQYRVENFERFIRMGKAIAYNRMHISEVPLSMQYQTLRGIPKEARPMVYRLEGMGVTITSIRMRLLTGEAKPMK